MHPDEQSASSADRDTCRSYILARPQLWESPLHQRRLATPLTQGSTLRLGPQISKP